LTLEAATTTTPTAPTAPIAITTTTATFATETTAPTAAITEPAATTAGSFFAGLSFVHGQGAPAEVLAVHSCNGGLRFVLFGHFYKAKAAGLAAELVLDDGRRAHSPKGFKGLTQFFFGSRARQITYIDVHFVLL
jgi:hypothetical protein